MARRGRTMKRTMEEFPEALTEQMAKYGYTNKSLADAIGVSPAAICEWKSGRTGLPAKKNRRMLIDLLNLEITPSTLSNEEAIAVNEITSEQLKISFDIEDADEDEKDVEHSKVEPKWVFIYSTNNSDSYRSAVMHRDRLPKHFRLLMVTQRLQDKKESIPFVAIPVEATEYED